MIDKYKASYLAEELRASFGKDNLSPIDIFELARAIPRLTVVLYPFGDSISGMCVTQERFSVIAVNSAQTYGRQRFTLAHELYHLNYDDHKGTSICLFKPAESDEVERMADTFASYVLLPHHALRAELKDGCLRIPESSSKGEVSLRALLEIENKYGVSRKALLTRLQEEGLLAEEEKEELRHDVIKNARELGFSTALYERNRGDSTKRAEGDYVNLITFLFSEDAISKSKAEELLAAGFRDDIWITDLENEDIFD